MSKSSRDEEKVPLSVGEEIELENTEQQPPPYHDGKVKFQPSSSAGASRAFIRDPPMDSFIFAIIATIFCCWPCGLVGLVRALHAMQAHYRGEDQRAASCNKSSKRWSLSSFVCGITYVAVVILFIVFVYYRIISRTRDVMIAQCLQNPSCAENMQS